MAEGVTRQSLAGLLDLEMASITQLASSGILVRSGVRGRYLLAPSVRNYVRHLREIAAGRQGKELNAVDENARLKMAQRRNYDLNGHSTAERLGSTAWPASGSGSGGWGLGLASKKWRGICSA